MRKTIKLLFGVTLVLAMQTNVFADINTNTFSRVTSDDLDNTMQFTVKEVNNDITDNRKSFSFHDYLTGNYFNTEEVSKNIITDEELIEEIIPTVSRSKIIIKNEIERIKKEERKKLEEQKRKEEERKRLARYQAAMNITVSSSNAKDIFYANLIAQLGKPYVYGGNGPYNFDCSGLSSYIYRKIGVNLPRTASDQQRTGVSVNRTIEDLKFGDLVFFKAPNESGASHVGIYVGDGQMIHAPRTGDVVKYTNIFSDYYKNRFFSAKRYVDFDAVQEENSETNTTKEGE